MPANMAADVVAAETQAEQVRLLMEGARTSLPASVAVATVAAYVQWPVIEHSVVAALGARHVNASILQNVRLRLQSARQVVERRSQ